MVSGGGLKVQGIAGPKKVPKAVTTTGKSPRFYPAKDVRQPLHSHKKNVKSTKICSRIQPGTIQILLGGSVVGVGSSVAGFGSGVSEERISMVAFRALGTRLNVIVLVIGGPVAQVTLQRYLDKRSSILSSANITI
jgi:hypothetical protein